MTVLLITGTVLAVLGGIGALLITSVTSRNNIDREVTQGAFNLYHYAFGIGGVLLVVAFMVWWAKGGSEVITPILNGTTTK